MGLLTASLLTSVGLTRQSTGPAISVRLWGWSGRSSSAMSAVAANAATHGWHTATQCARAPDSAVTAWVNSISVSMYSSSPKRPCCKPTSRALCQSVMYTSWSCSSVRAVSRSRVAKWPERGATSITGGCHGAPGLRKCSNCPNGVDSVVSSTTGYSSLPTCTSAMA